MRETALKKTKARLILRIGSSTALLFACRGQGSVAATGGEYTHQDSAGVAIVESPGEVARSALGWSVDTVAEVEIGRRNASGPYQFYNMSGVRQLTDGRIVVVDGASAELRLFDHDGVFLEAWGGHGGGPGEFEAVRFVPSYPRDDLLIYDRRLHRFTRVFEPPDSLGIVRSAQMRGTVIGATGESVLTFHTYILFSERELLTEDPASYRIFHLRDQREDTIGSFPGQVRYMTPDLGPIPSSFTRPFDVMPSAVAGERSFYITPGEGPTILRYNSTGALIGVLRLTEPSRPVTPADFDRFIDGALGHIDNRAAVAAQRNAYEQIPLPEEMPAFQSLLVDDLNWLWAEVYRPVDSDPQVWMVFDHEGQARGTVVMPQSLEVHQIGGNFVLGRWRDDLGIEYVRRHSLSRLDIR